MYTHTYIHTHTQFVVHLLGIAGSHCWSHGFMMFNLCEGAELTSQSIAAARECVSHACH